MESQLQELISQIKEEGVTKAKEESSKIIRQAEDKSAEIVSKAKKDAEETVKNAKKEVEKFQSSSEKALEQSARNIVLGLKNEITKVFDNLLKEKTAEVLSDSTIKEILIKFFDNWLKDGKTRDIEVLLNDKDKKNIEKLVTSALPAKMKHGVEFKPVKEIKKGFMIGLKGSNVYYDITDAGISEMLKEYLNPKLREILDKK
ncbi:MAG: hypothetical protein JW871_03805 [Endomicrobiales bacterium]|nr:hypothetical protein [Endomicrobiales bacterium]